MNNSFGTLAVVSNDLLSDILNKSEVVIREGVSKSSFNNILENFYEGGKFNYDDCSLIAINSSEEFLHKEEPKTIDLVEHIKHSYMYNDESVSGVFVMDWKNDNLLLATKKFIDDTLNKLEGLKERQAEIISLQIRGAEYLKRYEKKPKIEPYDDFELDKSFSRTLSRFQKAQDQVLGWLDECDRLWLQIWIEKSIEPYVDYDVTDDIMSILKKIGVAQDEFLRWKDEYFKCIERYEEQIKDNE